MFHMKRTIQMNMNQKFIKRVMKKLTKYLLILMLSGLCYSQTTHVTGTVVDAASQAWANGVYQVDLLAPSSAKWSGGALVRHHSTQSLDGSGAFAIDLPDNNYIT